MPTAPLLLSALLLQAPAPESESDWLLLEDPDLRRLPATLLQLPHAGRIAYESGDHDALLLVRHLEGVELVDAIGGDEQAMAADGSFVPVSDRVLETDGGEAVVLDCEWTSAAGTEALVAALYAPRSEGGVAALWLLTGSEASRDALAERALAALPHHQESLAPLDAGGERYESLLHGHRIGLRLVDPEAGYRLVPATEPVAPDREFFDAILAVNPGFVAGVPRDWHDPELGLSVTLQIYQTDTGLGPADPFVDWLAGQLQDWVRGETEVGDAPIRRIHLPEARTRVVAEEEILRHYAANRRAPEDGVILKTYIPDSPYARACRITFVDGEDEPERIQRAWLVELRGYPRSRTETITRTCVVLLRARAADLATLDRLGSALGFSSEPVDAAAPLAELD